MNPDDAAPSTPDDPARAYRETAYRAEFGFCRICYIDRGDTTLATAGTDRCLYHSVRPDA